MNNSSNINSDYKLETELLENLKAPKMQEFGPEFDVFDFAEKNGRETCLLSVSHPIFHYKNINKYIDFYKFPDFVNQIRIGYTSSPDAHYHTVIKIHIFFIFKKDILKFFFC